MRAEEEEDESEQQLRREEVLEREEIKTYNFISMQINCGRGRDEVITNCGSGRY